MNWKRLGSLVGILIAIPVVPYYFFKIVNFNNWVGVTDEHIFYLWFLGFAFIMLIGLVTLIGIRVIPSLVTWLRVK